MQPKDVYQWLLIGALILGAGIWLGRMQQQVWDLNAAHVYHWGVEPAKESK